MSIELGHFALILAFALSLVQVGVSAYAWQRPNEGAFSFVRHAGVMQFVLVLLSFAALTFAFVTSDFSLKLAYEHSHSLQPTLYKFTSVWGNHEGSLLLWVLILTLFGAAVAVGGANLPKASHNLVLGTQGFLTFAFIGFTIFTSNPFERLPEMPLEGRDLNPILQDIGLAIHPPLLYLGYVGFSVCFSFAIAALISGKIDAAWARWVRPWTMLSWIFLTLGIAMGSYWAYYELGWGGWWFWDPVENASFMPWLTGTALLHSALVMEKRGALKIWTILLAIITFSLSLLGTFLVRSGILTSVHSFATDPSRGLVILGMLTFFICGAFILFAWRAPTLKAGGLFSPISREAALVFNNLFLATATIAVLVGTLYPLVLDAFTGIKISVGAPFFDLTFGALMVPLLLVVPFGPFLPWKRASIAQASKRLFGAIVLSLILAIIVAAYLWEGFTLTPLGILLGFWVIIGALADLVERSKLFKVSPSVSLRRLAGLPKNVWSTSFAHMGLGLTVLGVVFVTAFETETITTMQPGDQIEAHGYSVRFVNEQNVPGPNFTSETATFAVAPVGKRENLVASEKRNYPARQMPTTEAGITTFGLSQVYISIGDRVEDNGRVVRIWTKPWILLIWIGTVVMALAGTYSLTDRKYRIAAPNLVRKQALGATK
ncbi:heme lyase CcmF/NrfE family subunit [Maritalea mediterranea]|uniref:Heme lyase CcmF/NrfE family subunit n=1 Tax=Maritalea mediterranea TaxID=2909667 RepID=A0ABS9E511_9HYPH|nr:heme lyase CcmF/NrfE family subunit [Maritalea mediterranea]MCF4097956.1 heme lyase CcmF/NrfE family subunit [Maritalea mediterranea]